MAERLSHFGFSAPAIGAALGKIRTPELEPENEMKGAFWFRQEVLAPPLLTGEYSPHDAHKWRREKPAEATFALDLTVWQQATEQAAGENK